MITVKEAVNEVKNKTGYEFIIKVKDYDQNHYVVEAIPKKNELPEPGIQTTFGVDKNTGKVTSFYLIPGETLEKYLACKVCNY